MRNRRYPSFLAASQIRETRDKQKLFRLQERYSELLDELQEAILDDAHQEFPKGRVEFFLPQRDVIHYASRKVTHPVVDYLLGMGYRVTIGYVDPTTQRRRHEVIWDS